MFYLARSKKFVSVSITQIFLFLTSLINFKRSSVTELGEIRSHIMSATMCSEPSDLYYLHDERKLTTRR